MLAVPMSMPPATPTKPPATPPATVRDLKSSVALTLTDCVVLVVASWLIQVPPAMNAFDVACSSVTPTPPATPTKPPPALAESPKKSSLAVVCTARPWKLDVVPKPFDVTVPT